MGAGEGTNQVAFEAGSWVNAMGVDGGAEEGDALVDGLEVAFVRVEGEVELMLEVMLDDWDGGEEALLVGVDDEEIIDVAAIMLEAEVVGDEAVELVKEDIGEELAGEVADGNATSAWGVKEALAIWEAAPGGARRVDDDVVDGVVEDDLAPEELTGLVGVAVVGELLVEAPDGAAV
jgi:hypothetical protein